jgi:hypothetical protein
MSDTEGRMQAFFQRNETAFWVLLITAFACVLRFSGLTFQSYWFDELFSAYYSNPAHSVARVIELTLADVHPPLHQLSMWLSYRTLGYTEFAGRLPSALAGVATVPVIYLLARELFDKQTGLYAAALATPNYYLVYYAQEARSYAFLCFLSCLSMLFFIRALRSKSWLNLSLYTLATIALLYTHYFAFVILAIQGAVLLVYWLRWARADRQLLVRAGIALVLVLAALSPLVPFIGQHAAIKEFWITQPPLRIALTYFIAYFNSAWLALFVAVLSLAALTAVTLQALRVQQPAWPTFAALALLIWIGVGFLLPWFRGLMAQPVITDRNTIILVPPIIILSAFGLRVIPTRMLQKISVFAVLTITLYHLVFGIQYYTTVKKNQYREITAALTAYPVPLPLYALKHNETKYNVYFEQSNSHLRAVDYRVLESKLEAGTAEPVFWLVGGHLLGLDTDLEERFNLIQVALYSFRGAVAELLLNPDSARRVPVEPSVLSGNGGNWITVRPFVWKSEHAQLLVGLNAAARRDPLRKVQVDLLDVKGHILESHSAELGAVPSTMQIFPEVRAGRPTRLVLRMPEGEPEPEVWLIEPDSAIR